MLIQTNTAERFEAPEYRSDNEATCGECLYIIDFDEEPFCEMDDDTIRCRDCRESCSGCGEWVRDPNPVRLRCPAIGRLESYCTPECAALNFEE